MITTVDAVGFTAATATTIAFVPQVLRIVRTRSAHDISWLMFGIISVGAALWLGYGLLLDALPVVVANAVTLALAATILVLKWRYGRDLPPPHGASGQESGPTPRAGAAHPPPTGSRR
jgi:MtN3 and saliva related transmembrane protein